MAEAGPDIGTTLRETRMRARIDIGEVEMRTKIRAKYLRAIENEEWDLLPGPVYVKSFLRTYGDYLGLDSRQLVDEYKRRYEIAPDVHGRPLSTVKREREREQRRQLSAPRLPAVPSWAVIGVILAIVVVAIIVVGTSGNSSPKSPTSLAVNTQSGGSRHHSHTGAGSGRSAITPSTTTGTSTTTTTATAAKATLKIVPTSDVWVCVENGAGKPVVVGGKVYGPGDTVPTASGSTLLVGLGNNDADFTIDGKPYHPTSTSSIALKITPTAVTTLSAVPVCGQPS